MASVIPTTLASCGSPATTTHELDIEEDIPVFDLSDIQLEKLAGDGFDEDYQEKLLRSEFRRCCEDLGCFRLKNHGISNQLIERFEILCRDVFKLPTETSKKMCLRLPSVVTSKEDLRLLITRALASGPTWKLYMSSAISCGLNETKTFGGHH